ncbi:MAG: peptidase S8 [Candidatus Eremiobacteraeota bacterium]|nr:peptidase S8 [Candidatus Eremiobacteraeota bacterium]
MAIVAIVGFAGCSGSGSSRLGLPPSSSALSGRTALDATATAADAPSALPGDAPSALPGDAPSALPGDAPSALPGDAPSALPGDAPSALPGTSRNVCAAAAPGQASCLAILNLDIAPVANPNANPLTIKGFAPKDLLAAYHLPAGGAGRTVAIVDAYDDPTVEADLAVYRTTFGLTPCTSRNGCFRKVNQAGVAASYPVPDVNWAKEIALDVDMVSASCPACNILLVEANSASIDDLGASVDKAVTLGANTVSNSYAATEWADEINEEKHFNHVGIAVTVASGDSGIGATYPAASRYVTAVGGTVLTGGKGAYNENSGWKNTGRGCSQFISKPWWQANFKCSGRAMTDVAAVADPASGVAAYDSFVPPGQSGGWMVFGGTSVGAPIIASAYALANDFTGRNSAARLYSRYKLLHDVPPVGWDYVTGVGSPKGVGAF